MSVRFERLVDFIILRSGPCPFQIAQDWFEEFLVVSQLTVLIFEGFEPDTHLIDLFLNSCFLFYSEGNFRKFEHLGSLVGGVVASSWSQWEIIVSGTELDAIQDTDEFTHTADVLVIGMVVDGGKGTPSVRTGMVRLTSAYFVVKEKQT